MKFMLIKLLLLFFCIANINAEVKVLTLNQSTTSWDKSILPEYASGQPEITIKKYLIPAKTSLNLHKHPMINAAYILSGELIVTKESDNSTLHLKAGDTMIELVNQWHLGKNATNEPVEIIVFYAGVIGDDLVINK